MQLTYKGPEKRIQVAMIGKEAALPNTVTRGQELGNENSCRGSQGLDYNGSYPK